MGKYQILEHTADKGLAVEAHSLPDLFETAARGLFRLMIDPDRYPPTEQVVIELHAPDLESTAGQVAERAAVPLRGASSAVQSVRAYRGARGGRALAADGAGALSPD
jgi:SHS2 domain-containing protein